MNRLSFPRSAFIGALSHMLAPRPSPVGCRPTLESGHMMQPRRGTQIFRRMYPVAYQGPQKTGPFRPKLKKWQFVYILEENTDLRPAGDMDVILATDIQGLGLQGDVVTVKKTLARTHMLPVGVAEYVSPQNLAKYADIRKAREAEPRQTLTALKTIKQLSAMTLPVPMSASVPWTLTKAHIRVALRMAGVEVAEDCITLPEEPITQHQTTNITITVNGMDRVAVKTLIYPYNKTVAPVLPPIWPLDSTQVKFDLEQVIAEAAHRMHRISL